MVFSSLQALSLRRFLLSQGGAFLLFLVVLFFLKTGSFSFALGGLFGEVYLGFVFFLTARLFNQKTKKGLTIVFLFLKWPVLAFFIYKVLDFVNKVDFVMGLSFVIVAFGFSFIVARRD